MDKIDKKHREKIIESVIGSLRDEDIEGIFDIDDEKTDDEITDITNATGFEDVQNPQSGEEEAVQSPAASGVRRIFVGLAVVMIFFSVIGFIVSMQFVLDKADAIKERRALKEEFEQYINPVVINDPPAYDSVDNLPQSTMITSALWKIILTGDKSNYATDIGVIYIPAADVESSAHALFGTGTLEHQTVSSHGIQLIYSSLNNNYEIPESFNLSFNSPRVTSVTNIGEAYTVTVDYIPPGSWRNTDENEIEPIKTMVYTITRIKKNRTSVKMSINSIKQKTA